METKNKVVFITGASRGIGLATAKKVLAQKMDILHKIARELISKETLEQKDFYSLVR